LVICNYRTSNDSIFYRDNGYDRFDTKSILLDAAFSVEVLMVGPQMAAPQVAAAVLKAQMAAAVSKAQCRLQVVPRLVASQVAWAVQALYG
jgi:hypothetical protein